MALADYQISVINVTTGRVEIIFDPTTFVSVRYSRKINDIGAFVAVLPYTTEYYAAFGWDNYVEIKRTDPDTGDLVLEETYLVRAKHRYREGNIEQIVVGGLSLNHLLARRIIDPDDDPTATDGYSVKSGAADTVMRGYVREQAGDLASVDRAFPQLTVAAVAGTGVSINKSFRYDNLFNAMQEMAAGSGIDFRIERIDFNFTQVVIGAFGVDRTRTTNEPQALPWLGLSPVRGNLQEPSLNIDRTEEKNYVYVLGQGQGEERIVVKAYTSDVTLSPYNRIEFSKDQRNVGKLDIAGLQTSATTQLNSNQAVNDFTFKPIVGNAGSVYRSDWDIGDKATVIWDDVEMDLRIAGIEIEIDETGETFDVNVETIVYA